MSKIVALPPVRDFVVIINRFLERFEAKEINFDDPGVVFYFSALRQLIEQSALEEEYKILMLYANWVLHPKLTRKSSTFLLDGVRKAIIDHLDNTSNASDQISKTIGAHLLRESIKTLNGKFGLRGSIVDRDSNWKECFGQISVQLTHKPMYLEGDKKRGKPSGVGCDLDLGQPIFWLTGDRGQPVDWCVSFVPYRQDVELLKLLEDPKVVTFAGGLFFS